MRSAKRPLNDSCGDGAGLQERSNSGGRKLSNQPSADEPDYGVPDFYADDQAGLDGSCDLEVERCDLLMGMANQRRRPASEPVPLRQRRDLHPTPQHSVASLHGMLQRTSRSNYTA